MSSLENETDYENGIIYNLMILATSIWLQASDLRPVALA